MGNSTSNSTQIQQEVNNNFFTSNTNNCYASASSSIIGTDTIITSTGKVGDICVNCIEGSLSASCSIVQQTNQSVANILKAQASQTASTTNDLFNDGVLYSRDHNSVDMSQKITNNITSINSNTCNAVAAANISYTNTVLQLNDAGNVTVNSINTDVNGTCSISNTVNQDAKSTSDADAGQEAQNLGMFSAFFMMITSLCVLAIVCLFLFFGGGALIYGMSGKKKETPPPAPQGGYDEGYEGEEYGPE